MIVMEWENFMALVSTKYFLIFILVLGLEINAVTNFVALERL